MCRIYVPLGFVDIGPDAMETWRNPGHDRRIQDRPPWHWKSCLPMLGAGAGLCQGGRVAVPPAAAVRPPAHPPGPGLPPARPLKPFSGHRQAVLAAQA